MKYGILFVTAGLLFAAYAVVYGGLTFVLLWPAVSFSLVGSAYLGLGVSVFGKRPDGSMSVWSVLLLLPYLAYLWTVWYVLRLIKREPPHHVLVPGILIGRRLLASEFPGGVSLVVDLTCEFPEPVKIRLACEYHLFPILDGSVSATSRLIELAKYIEQHKGTSYIHCAEGHGRTGVVAAVLLLQMQKASSAAQAITMVQDQRPLVRLGARQRRIVEAAENAIKELWHRADSSAQI